MKRPGGAKTDHPGMNGINTSPPSESEAGFVMRKERRDLYGKQFGNAGKSTGIETG